MAARALPVLQMEKGSIAWPPAASPGATGVRGAGLCVTPGTLSTWSWCDPHSHGPFQVPSLFLHPKVPLLEQWLSPFLIHRLSQAFSKEAPACELLFFFLLFEQGFHVQAKDPERFTDPAWLQRCCRKSYPSFPMDLVHQTSAGDQYY